MSNSSQVKSSYREDSNSIIEIDLQKRGGAQVKNTMSQQWKKGLMSAITSQMGNE